jgi:hypothetical protein
MFILNCVAGAWCFDQNSGHYGSRHTHADWLPCGQQQGEDWEAGSRLEWLYEIVPQCTPGASGCQGELMSVASFITLQVQRLYAFTPIYSLAGGLPCFRPKPWGDSGQRSSDPRVS